MHSAKEDTVTLLTDCDAILIPSGTPLQLKAGTEVVITQSMGGAYTVYVEGNLARIAGEQAQALGQQHTAASATAPVDPTEPLETQVWNQLKTCYDPEIPVNIVDLGLIYHCRILNPTEGGHHVLIDMTLTAPGCGMGPVLAMDVKQKVLAIAQVEHVEVELVFDPPWDRDRMSEAAKLQLGML